MVIYGIVFWTVCAGVVLVGLVLVIRTSVYLIGLKLRGSNNNEAATDRFWDLVRGMESEMIIHDDGETESFYNDKDTVDLVRSRLRADPSCSIRCVFNLRNQTLFAALCQEFPDQFKVQYARSPEAGGLHYKVVDGGAMAYLSHHSSDGESREFEFFDYRWCPQILRPRVFTKFRHDFDRKVDAAILPSLETVG